MDVQQMEHNFYLAVTLYRQRKYEKCIEVTNSLWKTELQESAWELKVRARTERVYVNDIDANLEDPDNPEDESGSRTATAVQTTKRTARPRTATGQPLTGISRPGMIGQRPGSSYKNVSTPRTRSGYSRNMRLGSASMFSYGDPEGPLLQISQMDLRSYGKRRNARLLFKYLYYHEGNIKIARDLCKAVLDYSNSLVNDSWWWQQQLGKCCFVLGLIKDAEKYLRTSLTLGSHPDTVLLLARVYMKLKLPEAALEICKISIGQKYSDDITLLTQQARILESMQDINGSLKMYRKIGQLDAMNCEALASIAVHHFYNNQPEMALLYYRRILAMGVNSVEIYCNIGLCCLYCRQIDLVIPCFQRAFRMATTPEQKADLWYNFSFVSSSVGDFNLAKRALRLCISYDGAHFSALNNLAVFYIQSNSLNKAKSYLAAAKTAVPDNEEIDFNSKKLANMIGK